MTFLDRVLGWAGLQRRSHPSNPDSWLVSAFGGARAATGIRVTESNAVSWSPIMSGLRFLAETQAGLPLRIYQRSGEHGKKQLYEHPIARLVRHGPNPEQTWFEYMELSQGHAVLWGNSYSEIVWNGLGEVAELWPLNPDRVQMKRDLRGKLVYQVSLPGDDLSHAGGQQIIQAEDMLHVRGFSRWGLIGERMADIHREAIGLGLATEEFAARFFGQGATPSGVLEHPGQIGPEAAARLIKSFEESGGGSGLTGAHRTKLLEEGMKWHQVTVDPEKAQFLGLREFQIQEAARILRIPPHLLYDLSRATFTNIEHQGIEVVIYTLMPWAKRWESRLNKMLVSDKMKNQVYVKFALEGLLRGDSAARAAFYASGRTNGWLSVNDIRELEDMNPVPEGDTYLQPANMLPLGTTPAPAPAPTTPEPDDDDLEEAA